MVDQTFLKGEQSILYQHIKVTILLLLLAFFFPISPAGADRGWKTYSTSHLIVYYDRLDIKTVIKIANDAESSYLEMTQKLWKGLNKKIKMYVYNNEKDYVSSLSYIKDIKLTPALADPSRFAVYFSPPVSKQSITHELNHIFLHHLIHRGKFPDWFDEGMSEFLIQPNHGFVQSQLKKSFDEGALIPNRRPPRSNLQATNYFYQAAHSKVDYLYNVLGPRQFKSFLNLLEQGGDFQNSLRSASGGNIRDLAQFDIGWRRYVGNYEKINQNNIQKMTNEDRNGYFKWYNNGEDDKKYFMNEHSLSQSVPDHVYIFEGRLFYGRLDGEIKGYYSTDHSLYIVSHYAKGEKHGRETIYHMDGSILSDTYYRNGQKHGMEKIYNEQGKLVSEKQYDNGQPVGSNIEYHLHGQKKAEINYVNGKEHSINYDFEGKKVNESFYDQEGNWRVIQYHHGRKYSEKSYKSKDRQSPRHGKQISYYDNGIVRNIVYYDNNKPVRSHDFNESGQLQQETLAPQ